MPDPYEQYFANSTLEILVKPGSPRNEILGYDEDRKALRVAIKAHAEDNKANVEIIRFFSKLTGKQVKIINGLKNKKKVLRFI